MALWALVHRRMLHEPALTLALLVGWLATVALVSAIPMYTDAINQALLRQELQTEESSRRPAFGFLFVSTDNQSDPVLLGGYPVRWDGYLALRNYFQFEFPSALRLPVRTRMHFVRSDLFQLFPTIPGTYGRGRESLSWVNLGFITSLGDQISLLEGTMPSPNWSPGEPVEVLVADDFADELGLQVGEIYSLFNPSGVTPSTDRAPFTLPVRIAGIWHARTPDSAFWYISSRAFRETLLVNEELYIGLLGRHIPRPLYELSWYESLDGGNVRAENVAAFLRRMRQVETQIGILLPGTRLTLLPESALIRYQLTVSAQSALILLLGLPVIGLILLFIALTASSMVERQQVEISILKSRGSGSGQIITTYVLQAVTLAFLALILGLPLGWLAAQAMGGTRQFMTFNRTTPLLMSVTRESIQYAFMALILALGVTLLPAYRSARLTIVAAKQMVGRQSLRSLGMTFGIDLLIFVAAIYGYYLLDQQGRITQLEWGEGVDPWENPLLFLAPSLFLLAGVRLYLHLIPAALHLLERVIQSLPGITLLLSIQGLARNSHQYRTLLMLLTLTAGLGTFVTSVARTLDDNLVERMFYQVGAQIAVVEKAGRYGASTSEGGEIQRQASTTTLNQTTEREGPVGWAIPPLQEHRRVAGVQEVARVGRFPAHVRLPNQSVKVELYGIDRIDWPRVAYFRRDFAQWPLGTLMNELALDDAGILVRDEFLDQTGLQIGDSLEVRGLVAGSSQALFFKIVGPVDLFPTAYPTVAEFFVVNLEYIFTQLGGPLPYHVWLKVDEQVDASTLTAGLEEVGFEILDLTDVREEIAHEQQRPERIGLFGFLSLGFIATTALSILALATHAFLMYRRRFIQMGIMRAIGLSSRQIAVALAGEQTLTTTLGILGGALLGLITSQLFIPFMQIGYTEADLIPPFIVVIAWRDVTLAVSALLGASLLITLGVAWLLSRLRVFHAIKMGEAIG